MATESHKLKVGIFVFISFTLIIIAFGLYGIKSFGAKTNKYLTYFNQSVQGLSSKSDVKFRGIKVGVVQNIDLAPDGKLVQITLSLFRDSEFQVCPSNVVTLQGSMLTGIKYIEIGMRGNLEHKEPALYFVPQYPVIASYPSPDILTLFDEFQAKIKDLNTKEISEQAIKALNTLNSIFTADAFAPIYTNVLRTTESLTAISSKVNAAIGDEQIKKIINDTQIATRKFRDLSEQITPAEIDKFVNQLTTLTDKLNSSAYICENSIIEILSDLQRAANNLKSFTENLKDRPSQTLFGKSKKDKQ